MSLIATVRGERAIHRVNPVAKIAAALAIGTALLVTIDVVSGAVALALELLLLPFAGVPVRALAVRTLPLIIAAPLAGVTFALYGRPSGQVHFQFLFAVVSDGSLELAAAAVLRVLAVGLPAVVLVATVDPTDLADGLAQRLRLPARFVLGGLAAFRLVGLLVEDWRSLRLARRARGVGDGTGFLARVRVTGGAAFALLVLAVRRAAALSTAMEARGFGGETPRTWSRRSRWGTAEWVLIAIGVAIATAAIAAAVSAGTWNFILGPS